MTTQSVYQLVYKNSLYPTKLALSPQGHITDSRENYKTEDG